LTPAISIGYHNPHRGPDLPRFLPDRPRTTLRRA